MKKLCIMLTMIVLASSISIAQGKKAAKVKDLQDYLPSKNVKGFNLLTPTGNSRTTAGMPTSIAVETYQSIQKDTIHNSDPIVSIEVKISDMIGMPYITTEFQTLRDSVSVRGNLSQKTVTVAKKYKGLEETNNGNNKSCKISFAVANRYIVTLEASGSTDVSTLYDIIDSMNLNNLEKLSPTN